MFINVKNVPKLRALEAFEPKPEPLIFGLFDKAYFINLDIRLDRRRNIEDQLQKLNIEAERFTAKKPNNKGKFSSIGARGCTESHFSLIRLAKQNKFKNVLIFEDDVIFCKDFIKRLNGAKNFIKQAKWDMFYFNFVSDWRNPTEILWRNINGTPIYIIRKTFQTHAYAISNKIYDLILANEQHNTDIIDVLYADKLHKTIKVYGMCGMATQSNSRSDIQCL